MLQIEEEVKKMGRYVYLFGGGKADGDGTQKELLGGKGAGLAEMTRLGVPRADGSQTASTKSENGLARSSQLPISDKLNGRQFQLESDQKSTFGAPRKNPTTAKDRSRAA